MKKIVPILFLLSISLTSCKFIDKIFKKKGEEEIVQDDYGLTDEDNQWEIPDPKDFSYIEVDGGIKLTKYNPSKYIPFVLIPDEIDGKKVIATSKKCFTNKTFTQKKSRESNVDEEEMSEEDAVGYFLGTNLQEIEYNSFNPTCSFFTSFNTTPENWEDPAVIYSAVDAKGRTYYSLTPKDVFVYDGVIYLEDRYLDAYFVARCLSKSTQITIVPRIKGKPVIQVGYSAFYQNKYLESINFSGPISDINSYAFYECKNLKEINFDCPNLTAINEYSFSGCELLDIVHLPKNLSSTKYRSFEYCGVLSEVYIPASMSNINSNTFYETTVKDLYYGGTEEMWNDLIKDKNMKGLEETTFHYSAYGTSAVLETPSNKYEELENGTQVTITGIIMGFEHEMKTLFLSDASTGYTIKCYSKSNQLEDIYECIGRKLTVSGTKSQYYSSSELMIRSYLLNDDKIYSIKLNEIDWSNVDIKENTHLYSTVVATIKSYTSNSITLNEYDFKVKGTNCLSPNLRGQTICVKGYMDVYNVFYEFLFDDRQLKILGYT